MKRSGFKRTAIPRPAKPPLQPLTGVTARMVTMSDVGVSVPKFDYVRSEPLMRAYRCIPCQHCGADDGTVCGAHSNWAEHGKGRGRKASDIYCASLCFTCHSWLDQGRETDQDKREAWDSAHDRTINALITLAGGSGVNAARLRKVLVSVGLLK